MDKLCGKWKRFSFHVFTFIFFSYRVHHDVNFSVVQQPATKRFVQRNRNDDFFFQRPAADVCARENKMGELRL